MTSFTKRALSGSTHGRGIKVTATAIGSGDTIHTASATSTEGEGDLVTLFVYNSDTQTRVLTLGWGGTTDPDDLVKQTIPFQAGLTLVTADMLLRNSLVIKAACDSANKLVVWGYVNRAA